LKRIVVFASGSGSNFQSILDSIQSGSLPVHCTGLICDREGIYAIDRAQQADIPVYVIRRRDFDDVSEYALSLVATLQALDPDLIVLAGYLSKVPEMVVANWAGRIINIHPALLPKFGGKGFYGLKVHQAVIDSSETESGCTVHFVDEVYDHGSVIEQAVVPVLPDDTPESLQLRVLEQEHSLLPKVIHDLLINKKLE
jgi:formyltetrahydrofolate-dependent phosphoribosylglycinamide formyltransferase